MAPREHQGEPDPRRLVGRVIDGRYRIVELLDSSSTAHVYRAEQNAEPRALAVKVLPSDIAHNKTAAARFHREAKVASKLDHPGIARVFGWGVDDGIPFIAMELLEGEDLFTILGRAKRLDPVFAMRITAHVCDALARAHDLGVVHRDLKPENVMVLAPGRGVDEGAVKVLDFGIAKLLAHRLSGYTDDETVPQALTTVGSAIGTPSHMAPEQARGAEVDGRADVYAVGVLLYEMVTGHLPFEGDNPIAVAVRQVRDPPPAPGVHVPSIDKTLERIILRCLEKAPEDRWGSARTLGRQLERLLRTLDTRAHADTGEEPGDVRSLDDDEIPTRRQPAAQVRELIEKAMEKARAERLADERTASVDGARATRDAHAPARGRQGTEIMLDPVASVGALPPRTAKRDLRARLVGVNGSLLPWALLLLAVLAAAGTWLWLTAFEKTGQHGEHGQLG